MYRLKTDKRGIERRISGNNCVMYRKKTNKRGLIEEYQVISV